MSQFTTQVDFPNLWRCNSDNTDLIGWYAVQSKSISKSISVCIAIFILFSPYIDRLKVILWPEVKIIDSNLRPPITDRLSGIYGNKIWEAGNVSAGTKCLKIRKRLRKNSKNSNLGNGIQLGKQIAKICENAGNWYPKMVPVDIWHFYQKSSISYL